MKRAIITREEWTAIKWTAASWAFVIGGTGVFVACNLVWGWL